jgi:hypothetical protein
MTDYYVMFWNLENLFDVENSPRRTEKLQRTIGRELRGWTAEVLARKISQLGSISRQVNGGRGPDLAGVCEVENEYVLDLLVAELAPLGRDYRVAHADTADNRGIDVAFIYDAALFTAEDKFSHYIVKRSATRDLFQVNFRTNAGNLLILVGNHWPARAGGQYASEPYRIIAAETLAYFHQRIQEVLQSKDVAVLALGDFNDEPFNRSLTGYALSEQSRQRVTRARTARFLNLMWPVLGQSLGTYYSNEPQVLDQFLVSKGLLTGKSGIRVDDASAEVMQYPEMIKSKTYHTPWRFGRGRSLDREGYSDHYPVGLRLSEG